MLLEFLILEKLVPLEKRGKRMLVKDWTGGSIIACERLDVDISFGGSKFLVFILSSQNSKKKYKSVRETIVMSLLSFSHYQVTPD
jgi:hypothetical protein